MKVEEFEFPSTVKPPGSTSTLFLAGAGVRGLQIKDQFIKFTTIGVYLADESIPSLSTKWKSKSPQELSNSLDFFMDIVKGEFEKFERITMILPLTGQQYSEKVMENAVAYMKGNGTYTESEAEAVEKFKEIFKNETFNPGSSILFTHSLLGHLTIGFSKDESIPEEGNAIIKNSVLSESILESIIGKNGVSPEAKNSVAIKVSELLSEEKDSEKIEGEKLLNKEEEDVEEKSEGKEASHSL